MNYDVSLTHDPGMLDRLAPEWTALLECSALDSVYLTPEWLAAYWETLSAGQELWLATVRDPAGGLVGLAPLALAWHSMMPFRALRWIGWRQIEFAGMRAAADHLDFLAAPGHEHAVVRAVLDALWARRFRWDVLHFGGIPAGSASLDALQAYEMRWEMLPPQICPRIALPDDWETYFMSLSRRKRKEQRRYLRQLDEAFPGEWEWRLVDTPEEVQATLAVMIAFHQAKWEALDHAGGFAEQAVEAFHHEVAQRFLRRGWLRLLRLEIRGEPVAVLYTLCHGKRVYDFASGFDFDFAEFSPGQVLTYFSIQQAIESGMQVYDFLRGAEEYKFRWGAEETADLTLRRIWSPQAQLARAIYDGVRSVWQGVKRILPGSLRQRMRVMLRRANR